MLSRYVKNASSLARQHYAGCELQLNGGEQLNVAPLAGCNSLYAKASKCLCWCKGQTPEPWFHKLRWLYFQAKLLQTRTRLRTTRMISWLCLAKEDLAQTALPVGCKYSIRPRINSPQERRPRQKTACRFVLCKRRTSQDRPEASSLKLGALDILRTSPLLSHYWSILRQ